MVKLIGIILILTSLLAMAAGTWIDASYGAHTQVTGNVVLNILTQPPVSIGFYDYLTGAAFSYAIISFIAGVMFLFRI